MRTLTKDHFEKLLVLLASVVLVVSLTGILSACDPDALRGTPATKGTSQLIVGATPAPHAEILELIVDDVKAQGYDLDIVQYTDYARINPDTDYGDIEANFFQHQPYLDEFNDKNGTDLVSVAAIHFEPLGIYPGRTTSLSALPDGATVAVPNDVTNEARALHLLAAEGLIELPSDADLSITQRDIGSNPKGLEFIELEAAAIPAALVDVDIAVINGNYAIGADLDISKILASEDADSQAAEAYANVVVVKAGSENDPAVQALVEALTSEKVRQFIEDEYDGLVVPVF